MEIFLMGLTLKRKKRGIKQEGTNTNLNVGASKPNRRRKGKEKSSLFCNEGGRERVLQK